MVGFAVQRSPQNQGSSTSPRNMVLGFRARPSCKEPKTDPESWETRHQDPTASLATGQTPTDLTDARGDIIEEGQPHEPRRGFPPAPRAVRGGCSAGNCLDCTFCRAWFPAFWLLDIMPQGTADWRNHYHRCCYQRVCGDNDDQSLGFRV